MIKIRCYRFFNFFYIYGLYILFFVCNIGLSDYRTVVLLDCRLSNYSYGPQIYTILFRSFKFLTPKDLFLINFYDRIAADTGGTVYYISKSEIATVLDEVIEV
jgi:hypothetical protein